MSRVEIEVAIPNFHKVNEYLYRGGQPDAEGFQQLKQLGVKTIISLRRSTEVAGAQQFRRQAEALGFRYESIPLSYFGFPKEHEVKKFFDIVNATSEQPVFVHCKHGSDRTGMMMAFYRMTNDNWTVEQAYDEMQKYGFHKLFVYHYKFAVFNYARRFSEKV